jgi:hypothetical protein
MAQYNIDPFTGVPSNLDPLTMGNPWMGGNNMVGGTPLPNLFGLPPTGSQAPAFNPSSPNISYQQSAPSGGTSYTPDYLGDRPKVPTGYDQYTQARNVPDSISTNALSYDSVVWNSARSQADYNAKLNANILQSYNERKARGENVEDPTPFLWDTDFNSIYSRGLKGERGNGLADQYLNGPSYYPIGVPTGAYNAINPEWAAKVPGWDGLGAGPAGGPAGAPAPPGRSFSMPNLNTLAGLLSIGNTPGFSGNTSTGGGSSQPFNVEDVNYWRGLVQNPQPFNTSQAWQDILAATDEQTRKNAGNLQEYFNVTGNRFSSSFGDSMSDYWEQVNRDQRALAAQLGMQSYETERTRQFGGAGNLAGLTSSLWNSQADRQWQSGENNLNRLFTGGENERNRGLQWDLNTSNQDFNQWLTNANQGFQAAMYNAGQTDQSAFALLNNATNAANQLNQNSILGANQLFGAENQALQNLFGSSVNSLPMWQQAAQFAQQMGLNATQGLGSLFNNNLAIGNAVGQGQYNT